MQTLEMFRKQGALELSWQQARQAFMAGNLGVYAATSSFVSQAISTTGGKFSFKTKPFPVPVANGRLPGGGSVVMMLAKAPEVRKAAWEYIKYATGPVGHALMVQGTGYTPVNRIAMETPTLLGDYYKRIPSHQASLDQLSLMTAWQT